jgi:hypothetical protein
MALNTFTSWLTSVGIYQAIFGFFLSMHVAVDAYTVFTVNMCVRAYIHAHTHAHRWFSV